MKRIILSFSICFTTLCITTSAMAIGLGGYFDMGIGQTSWGKYSSGAGADVIPTGGIILDTAAAQNKIFNYRFKFGGGKMMSGKPQLDKVGMTHTLGLSPVNFRGDEARFFFGPRLGMYYLGGEASTSYTMKPEDYLLGSNIVFLPKTKRVRLDLVRFDLGLVLLGFNFNLGDISTITFEFGINYGVMLGNKKGTASFSGFEGFATVGYMHRFNDSYVVRVKDIQ